MARTTSRLTAAAVQKTTAPGRYADGGGLYLIVDPAPDDPNKRQNKRWLCYFQWRGRRREMGLGPASGIGAVSLADAREAALSAKMLAKSGTDPIQKRRDVALHGASIPTFGAVAEELIKKKEPDWRAGHAERWTRSLELHAASLMKRPIDTIDTEQVLRVLQPLWTTKPETAAKLRLRIEAILDAAKVKGWRDGENPARWRGHLAHILPKKRKLIRGHHPAIPFDRVPALMATLAKSDGMSARALEWTLLTAAREGMTRFAVWGEIDEQEKVWTIPPERMKTGKEHRVPLSKAAIAVLERVKRPDIKPDELVFPGRYMRPLSNMAMDMLMRDVAKGYVPHGLRSTFRDWVGERTNFPREVAEAALAHSVGSAVELAYRRGDALEKRRRLMESWGAFATSAPRAAQLGSNVVSIAAR